MLADAIRERIRGVLKEQRLNRELESWTEELRREADIVDHFDSTHGELPAVRFDRDGPLSEKYGELTGFNGNLYSYNAGTDTITNSGLEIAGNNPNFATPGASDSLMTQRQWGFAPR